MCRGPPLVARPRSHAPSYSHAGPTARPGGRVARVPLRVQRPHALRPANQALGGTVQFGAGNGNRVAGCVFFTQDSSDSPPDSPGPQFLGLPARFARHRAPQAAAPPAQRWPPFASRTPRHGRGRRPRPTPRPRARRRSPSPSPSSGCRRQRRPMGRSRSSSSTRRADRPTGSRSRERQGQLHLQTSDRCIRLHRLERARAVDHALHAKAARGLG